MKELDKEKFQRLMKKARVTFTLTYFGHSNNLNVSGRWNDRPITAGSLEDEELVMLSQLVNNVQGLLMKEQIKRDLVPEEIKALYETDKKKAS